jgi:ubiquinone/menaquinone biosynthesis C-methylase UbiE
MLAGHQSARMMAAGDSSRQAEYTAERLRYWDEFAQSLERWQRARGYYQTRLAEIYRFLIPPGMRVLELGCGQGDLLAAVTPSYGVGVDLSPAMVERARNRHPAITFLQADAHFLDLGEEFDFIICADLVNDVWDVQKLLQAAARHAHPSTRLILNSYSRLWELPRRFAEKIGLARRQMSQNWLTAGDIVGLLNLADFEAIRQSPEIMWPVRTPLIDRLGNRYL